MTAYKTIYLHCDYPRCHRRVDTYRSTLSDARAVAADEEGWTSAAGLDLCGPPTDHAHAEHQPQTRSDGHGYVHVGCSCGWVHPLTHLRRYVDVHWRAHIREDVLGQALAGAPAPTAAAEVGS